MYVGGSSSISVIDARHCHTGDLRGCTTQPSALTPPVVTVGLDPLDAVADSSHDTLYVTDSAFGNSRGALSMIDTAHCDGADTSDCAAQTPVTAPMPLP